MFWSSDKVRPFPNCSRLSATSKERNAIFSPKRNVIVTQTSINVTGQLLIIVKKDIKQFINHQVFNEIFQREI